ncbi:MAG: GlcG/HbpS family heme-binding protein [Quisquiliibacterium sp.]
MFKSSISLQQAMLIAEKSLERGRELGFEPLTVVVLDDGGQVKVILRDDGCSLLRPEIATGKAAGALNMGFGGRELARRAAKMPMFFTALNAMSDGRMVSVPGGVLMRDAQGVVVGAVGISGDVSENDEICAVAGIKAAGLMPDTGDPLSEN